MLFIKSLVRERERESFIQPMAAPPPVINFDWRTPYVARAASESSTACGSFSPFFQFGLNLFVPTLSNSHSTCGLSDMREDKSFATRPTQKTNQMAVSGLKPLPTICCCSSYALDVFFMSDFFVPSKFDYRQFSHASVGPRKVLSVRSPSARAVYLRMLRCKLL